VGATSAVVREPVQTPFPTPQPAPAPEPTAPPNPEAEDEEDDGDWGISGYYRQENTNTQPATGNATDSQTTVVGAAITYRRDATDDQLGLDGSAAFNQTTTAGADGSSRQTQRITVAGTAGTNEAEMARAQRLAQGGN